MARRKKSQKNSDEPRVPVKDTNLDDVLTDQLGVYGTYVLEDRAIPATADGLKPVQRRILWALFKELGSRPEKNTVKSARIEGEVQGKFHPHSGIYNTMVNMVEGSTRPTVEGRGNFGSYSKNTPAAAPRYTEARLNKFSMACFFDGRFANTFSLIPNFDNSNVEPVILPAQLPTVLAFGSQGIAMGTSTHLPAFTTRSLYNLVVKALKTKNHLVNPKQCAKILEFTCPYGGEMISPEQDVLNFMKTGRGSIEWTCTYKVVDKCMHIVGIAPNWNVDSKIAKIASLPFVTQVADMGGSDNIDIRISFKRMNEDDLDDAMYKVEKLMTSKIGYNCNVVSRVLRESELVDTTESTFSAWNIPEIIKHWVEWRLGLEKRALKEENSQLRKRLSYLKLMLKATNNLDIIFKLLKTKKIDKVKVLAKKLKITEEQSKVIWSMQVGKLDRLSQDELKSEMKSLNERNKEVKRLYKLPAKSTLIHMKANKENLTAVI